MHRPVDPVVGVDLGQAVRVARGQGGTGDEVGGHRHERDETPVTRHGRATTVAGFGVGGRDAADVGVPVRVGAVPDVDVRRGEVARSRSGAPVGQQRRVVGVRGEGHHPTVVADRGFADAPVAERGVGRIGGRSRHRCGATLRADRQGQIDERDRGEIRSRRAELLRVGDQCALTADRRRIQRADVVGRTRLEARAAGGRHELPIAERTVVRPGVHGLAAGVDRLAALALRQPHRVQVPPVALIVVAEQVVTHLGDDGHRAAVGADHRHHRVAGAHPVGRHGELDHRTIGPVLEEHRARACVGDPGPRPGCPGVHDQLTVAADGRRLGHHGRSNGDARRWDGVHRGAQRSGGVADAKRRQDRGRPPEEEPPPKLSGAVHVCVSSLPLSNALQAYWRGAK